MDGVEEDGLMMDLDTTAEEQGEEEEEEEEQQQQQMMELSGSDMG